MVNARQQNEYTWPSAFALRRRHGRDKPRPEGQQLVENGVLRVLEQGGHVRVTTFVVHKSVHCSPKTLGSPRFYIDLRVIK